MIKNCIHNHSTEICIYRNLSNKYCRVKNKKSEIDIEKAIFIIENILNENGYSDNLSDVEELVMRQCWQKQPYQKIADDFGYSHDYVKQIGAKLWRNLSISLNTKVTKHNIHSVLRSYINHHNQ